MKANQKISAAEIQSIRIMHSKKMFSMKELAFMFGVVPQTISRIIGRKRRVK